MQGVPLVETTQSRIAASKTPKLLNIFVTKKHEDSHVEFSTISTASSFLIVTTNNKSLKIQPPSLKKQVNQVLSQHHCH